MFYLKKMNVRTFVHGDDYVSTGKFNNLEWMGERLENTCKRKGREILNRMVVWDQQMDLTYEVDPLHM